MNYTVISCLLNFGEGDMLARIEAGSKDAPLLVMTHGVTDSASSLHDAITRYSPTFHVVAIDTLGHGLSPRFTEQQLNAPMDSACLALHITIKDLVNQYGPAFGFGHSMGGAFLSRLAVNEPDLFRGIIVEDPAWLTPAQEERYRSWGPAEADRLRDLRKNKNPNVKELRAEYPNWPDSEITGWIQAKYDVDLTYLRTGNVGYTDPWDSWLPHLAIPTVVVGSDGADTLLSRERLHSLSTFDTLTPLWIPGLRHVLRRDRPDLFYKEVDRVLHHWVKD